MPAQRSSLLRSSALVLGLALLSGCQSMSSIDWQDRGNVGPAAIDGSPLTARVVDALAATPMTMNEQIKVVQVGGKRIRLGGMVSSTGAASEAVRIVQRVDGVSGVVDTISVR